MNNWYQFYKDRINSTYQEYFENRYKPFLDMIKGENPKAIFEAGCGIGSVSKALFGRGIHVMGIDLDEKVVDLANKNIGYDIFQPGNLFNQNTNTLYLKTALTVTHGVLEHFSDDSIKRILKLYPKSIHYVPLDKYEKPSFGDERLLSVEYWIKLVNPKEIIVFNNGYDLAFRI